MDKNNRATISRKKLVDKQEGYFAMVTGKTRKGRADNNGVFQTGEGGYAQNQKR